MSEDFTKVVTTLRAALESPSDAGRPGQLRLRMEAALGPEEAQRLRRLVHQVVGAAEENLPANLRRIAPLTSESLHRLSGELAASRGWTPDAAQRATQIWAAALGFEELAASSWPRETALERPAPAAMAPVIVGATAPPPDAADAEPPRPAPTSRAEWPKTKKQLSRHTHSVGGEPAFTAVQAYAGMNLLLCALLVVFLTVVLCLPILFLGTTGVLLPVIGVLLASVLVRKLGRGALVATTGGLEFTPYDQQMRNPRPEQMFSAPWSQVTVEPGYVTTYRFAGKAVQVGPRTKDFVAAAQPYVGRAPG